MIERQATTSFNLSIGSIGRAFGKAVDLRTSTEIKCARFKPTLPNMETENSAAGAGTPAQPLAVRPKTKRPGVVIAHRIFSSLAICFGIMWILIGLSLMQTSAASPSPSFSSGPGSQQLIYSHSSERDKAPTYVTFGAILAVVFAIGFFLKASPIAYIYHTILVVLLLGLFGAGLVLSIWWFLKRNRNYYGIGLAKDTAGR